MKPIEPLPILQPPKGTAYNSDHIPTKINELIHAHNELLAKYQSHGHAIDRDGDLVDGLYHQNEEETKE